jgi:hypothetical protein
VDLSRATIHRGPNNPQSGNWSKLTFGSSPGLLITTPGSSPAVVAGEDFDNQNLRTMPALGKDTPLTPAITEKGTRTLRYNASR